MSDKHERREDDQITFTLGRGNHSSICGGVTPMEVGDFQSEADTHLSSTENPVGVESEIGVSADAKVQKP